ncbi:MAG: ORF6N domain-containing protein [Flavobacteriales bacterium]|nr:ORF6N domain-containing protein [Flavobacteriales bacterium]
MEEVDLLADEVIAVRIQWVRGQKVMLDADLAALYGVPTKALNQQVRRNQERFPVDFAFELTPDEWSGMRSQLVTSKGRGGRRYAPLAFTEHGVLMLSSVLNSDRAIAVNIRIVRVFVRMSRLLQNDLELQLRMERMEGRQGRMEEDLGGLFEAVKQLMGEPPGERRRLGYRGGDPI